ncbi:MAG: helix-turn-helix transcriptional regulator [Treponema sp.]|jgi:DNA-binding CsgD family transcriptional regulator|nr:helix-turn-helix transcriptional regulator [Treponema sp.]
MQAQLNIHFEIFGTLMLFAMFWLLFYRLHYQESKLKRILLIVCMALYRPLFAILPDLFRILFPFVIVTILAFLAVAKKRSVWITAAYFLCAIVFIDAIAGAMVLGLSGMTSFGSLASINDLYIYGGLSIYITLFLAAVFYYSIMRTVPQEALDRIPLRIWLILLLIQPVGTAAFYVSMDFLLAQLDSGDNNFLFLGSFLFILFVLSLVIFYLFVNYASSYSARLLAGELNKAPPVYSPQSGLSPEFIKKYSLTGREAEITVALLRGKSDKEIAILFAIAVNTVQVHLKNIYRKTGAPGRYALMALAGLGR